MCNDGEKIVSYLNSSEIFALIVAFENCTLPREEWTRSTYLTVVFWYLYMNSLPEARRLIRDGIRRYNFEHNIITEAYSTIHETLVPMLVREVNDYLKHNRGANSFVNLANGLFRHIADNKERENNPKQMFYAVNSIPARSNKYEFISN